MGKRVCPPAVSPADLFEVFNDAVSAAKCKNYVWMITRSLDPSNQLVSSWTGFNIQTRSHLKVEDDVVCYLPTINAPATEMSTVQEILSSALKITSSLHLENVAVVLDQALFAKATEIAWKQPKLYGNLVLMMGNFHTLCNLMSSIGKMFGDAGLRDLAVESGVIAEGSINKVLEGKQYNRAVRFHKLMYEALMRLLWKGFQTWLTDEQHEDPLRLNSTMQALQAICDNACPESLHAAMNDDACIHIFELFAIYQDVLRQRHTQLAKFWMTYLDMVEILLGLIRADREGDWQLHLACIRRVIPWCFAFDKVNYSRYLPVYYAQMTKLETSSPVLHQHFMQGYFTVQLKKGNLFGCIAVDQTTEETVNKDTLTAGGTKGFSLKHGAISRYYLTAEHRASALRQLRESLMVSNLEQVKHPDLMSTRIKNDERDVNAIADLLENDWINPFDENPSDLISISTGIAAILEVANDILPAHEKGEEAYESFQKRPQEGKGFYDTIKRTNLKRFGEVKSSVVKSTDKEIILKADRRLFSTMILIAKNRKLDMHEVFNHPLGPLPWSLANVDGTMKKTNKAALSKHIENTVDPAETIMKP